MSEYKVNADKAASQIRLHLNHARATWLAMRQGLPEQDADLPGSGFESAITAQVLAEQASTACPADQRFCEMFREARALVQNYQQHGHFVWFAVAHPVAQVPPPMKPKSSNGHIPPVKARTGWNRKPISPDTRARIKALAQAAPTGVTKTEWFKQIADECGVAVSSVFTIAGEKS